MNGGEQRPQEAPEGATRRKQRVPEALQRAMQTALGINSSPTANQVLEAAGLLLDQVLKSDCETRASALDLLTVDALMTHALEIANRDPESFEVFSEQAMRRIASAG